MGIHIHEIIDRDPHMVIDPITREIKPEGLQKLIMVKGDHNSERYGFDIPRYVDGHDMSLCNRVQVHYINVNSNNRELVSSSFYEADDIALVEENDLVTFTWLISNAATKYTGLLTFAVLFRCVDEKTGEVVYQWGTKVFSPGFTISDGIINTESVYEDYIDILEKWKAEVATIPIEDIGAMLTAADQRIDDMDDKMSGYDNKLIEVDNALTTYLQNASTDLSNFKSTNQSAIDNKLSAVDTTLTAYLQNASTDLATFKEENKTVIDAKITEVSNFVTQKNTQINNKLAEADTTLATYLENASDDLAAFKASFVNANQVSY